MSYLDEFERIKGRGRSQHFEAVQTEALLHIAKCLSYMVDSEEERRKKFEFDPSKCVESITCNKNTGEEKSNG